MHIHTDHYNLMFVLNPLKLDPILGRHVMYKLQGWRLYLSNFSYCIEHIAGVKNVMADIMTRWLRGYRGKRSTIRRVTEIMMERI